MDFTKLILLVASVSGVLGASLLAAISIPFVKSYVDQKAKNLASHEDIERIVDQVREVTRATEAVKAEISDRVWNRQARWNLKIDVYSRLLGAVAERWSILEQMQFVSGNADLAERNRSAQKEIERASAIAGVLLSNDAQQLLASITIASSRDELRFLLDRLTAEARKDLTS